ncbi:30S ribosome-binding factor RbfA [Archangium sp.]|jgi:ribosome-binding factor A|uniref:30S ribosome-binding factor RbfA n=1 Tax=Archangium sp. TaxID=1872627 RepID=UPI00286C03B7|nr:30S ribosome-binding factor RbfA [Archangium sp.]HLM45345.1 30S ribosome-binding factor RbfA [Myxococcaceae bacterium]HZH79282.1 30S ribosome-binding factor RbfA [Archangium sp.]
MSTSNRPERVGQEIQAAIANILTRGELKDPRIGYITLTGVKVSPDLKTARVFYSMIGTEEQRKDTQKGLEAAKGFIRREVTEAVNLRVSPEIFFSFDESLERGDRIERLLREVKEKEGW